MLSINGVNRCCEEFPVNYTVRNCVYLPLNNEARTSLNQFSMAFCILMNTVLWANENTEFFDFF